MNPKIVLGENILSKMQKSDRLMLGKTGRTRQEIVAANLRKLEREIHNDFIAFLRRHELAYVHADPTRRSGLPSGHPDFLVTRRNRSLYVEFKVPPNQLMPNQVTYINWLTNVNHSEVIVVIETEPGAALKRASEVTTEFFSL